MSGAIILVVVSAYDYVAECAVAEELRRRRHRAFADTSPGSPFAARLAQYGLSPAKTDIQPDDPAPTIIHSPTDLPDLLDDLHAFHAWLLDTGSAALTRPRQIPREQARHLPSAGALSNSENEEKATASAPASLGLLDRLSCLGLAADR